MFDHYDFFESKANSCFATNTLIKRIIIVHYNDDNIEKTVYSIHHLIILTVMESRRKIIEKPYCCHLQSSISDTHIFYDTTRTTVFYNVHNI